jgi:hypothetical protein
LSHVLLPGRYVVVGDSVLVDEHEAVTRQAGMHALAKRLVLGRDRAVIERASKKGVFTPYVRMSAIV